MINMPISIDDIYRDAADYRITWEEALKMTIVIDDKGDFLAPTNDSDKVRLQKKAQALRPYIKSTDDPILQSLAKILYS